MIKNNKEETIWRKKKAVPKGKLMQNSRVIGICSFQILLKSQWKKNYINSAETLS